MRNDILLALLDRTKLGERELLSRLELALDPDYWKQLIPNLAIENGGRQEAIEDKPLDDCCLQGMKRSFIEQGYFHTEPMFSARVVGRMKECVQRLRAQGWPPVFAYIYDPFWQLLRSPSLAKFLTATLGAGYRQTAQIWLHAVDPYPATAGWQPHFDAPHRKNRITVWIALSDATLDNGCMYVVPRPCVPRKLVDSFNKVSSVGSNDLKALLQGSRALPTAAGAAIGWDCDIMHWGSLYRCGEARIAFSQVFVASWETPAADEIPVFDGRPPEFGQRLYVIAQAIKNYRRFEPLLMRYRDFAKRLSDSTKTEQV